MKDVLARGASVKRLPHDYRWPGGRHVAVVFNVAFEGWSDGKAPGIGPMGNPLPGGILRYQCACLGTLWRRTWHRATAARA